MKTNRNVVRLTEAQLRQMIAESVKKALNEKKLENSFDSEEDMTMYRDMYDPNDSESENGIYKSYMHHDFDDGYDYTGDDEYNEAAAEYNNNLRKRLATKGGQMSYDWDEQEEKNQSDLKGANDKMEFLAQKRDLDKNWRRGQLRTAEKMKKKWLNGEIDNDDFGYYTNESRLNKIVSESINRVLRKNRK